MAVVVAGARARGEWGAVDCPTYFCGGGCMSIAWDVTVDDIARLEPTFRDDVTALLAASPFDFRVVYAYRSEALQRELYDKYKAGGPKAAPPGLSAHNYGLAVDVQLWVPLSGQAVADTGLHEEMEWNVKAPGWQWLFAAVYKAPRLHSGISFGDYDHIERLNWKEFVDWDTREHPANA